MDQTHNNLRFVSRPHLTKEQRLPPYLKEVEKVLRLVKSCRSNFKTVLANSRLRGSIYKKVYSLTVNVLKYYNYIQKIIDKLELLEKEKFLRRELASVLIYEMIFGKNDLPGESKVITLIRTYEKDIMNVHQELQNNNTESLVAKEISIPRYARVHTLVTTVPYVIKDLEDIGFKKIDYDNPTEEEYLELVKNLERGSFLIDFHFNDILVFACGENLMSLDVYKNGHIFLQDKASYIPVHALNPEPGCAVLDACAAPGMKTVHIGSKMKNKGILIACEMDKKRFETLKEMIQYGGVKICKVLCKDFKQLDPNDQAYSSIEYILLDPSCSGSGMVNRMDEVTDTEDSKNKERLMKLAGFQIILLKHALRFPSVKKVVYSTCSVNEEENEHVVHEALNSCYGTFKLVPVMPEWSDRGSANFEFGELCLKTVPEKHLTNGFFVAMFERVDDHEYRKGVHFSKNKKHKMDNEAQVSSGFKKRKMVEWEKSHKKERMNEMSNSYATDNNYEEHLLHLQKKNKYESCEQPPDPAKENNNNSLSLKQFKMKGSASTLSMLNKVPEGFENSQEHMQEKHTEKKIDFDYDSKKARKKKKKEERDILGNFHSESKEELLEKMANMSKISQECLDEVSITPSKTADSSVSASKIKQKCNRYLSLEKMPGNVEINDSTANVAIHKKKKKKKEYSENENNFPDEFTNEALLTVKEKKRKNHSNDSTFHSSSEFNSSLITNNAALPSQNELSGLSETVLECSTDSSKHKRKKNKKHKSIDTSEINVNLSPDTELSNIINTITYNSEAASMCVSTKNDYLISKKSKKHKSKKHEVEKTENFEKIDKTFCHDNKEMCNPINSDFRLSKKCKNKKYEKAEDFEGTDEIISHNSEEMYMSALTQTDCITSKNSKKCKNEKHEVEMIDICERADNTHHNFEGMHDDCTISKKNKKCKNNENIKDFNKTHEIVSHDNEVLCMSTLVQNDYALPKKTKNEKHKVEIIDICEKADNTLRNFEGMHFSSEKDCVISKKSKKCKNKNNEKIEDFKKSDEIVSHDPEVICMSTSVQSDCALPKKTKNKKHKAEMTANCEKADEILPYNPKEMHASIENDCAVSKKSKKCKNKKHEKAEEFETADEIVSHDPEEICMSTVIQNDFRLSKKTKNKKHKSKMTDNYEKADEICCHNSEEMCASIQSECAKNKKTKKHKTKKHEIEKIDQIVSHSPEVISISGAIQSDWVSNKKSKKEEIEKIDISEPHDGNEKNLRNSEILLKVGSTQSDSVKIKKKKKYKDYPKSEDNIYCVDKTKKTDLDLTQKIDLDNENKLDLSSRDLLKHTDQVAAGIDCDINSIFPKSEEELEDILFSNSDT